MERVYKNISLLRNPKRLAADMLVDLWQSRYLGWTLAIRDIKAKYRTAWLGLAWAIFPPVATTLMFVALQRQQLLSQADGDVPYPVFTLCGIVLWQLFSESVLAPLQTIQASKSLLAKILFPREALLISSAIQVSFNFIIKLALLIIIIIWYDVPVYGSILWMPFICLGLMSFGILVGILLVPIGILYQDVIFSLGTILALLMFVTPVGYTAPKEGLIADFNQWNPVAYLIQGGRDFLFQGVSPIVTELLLIGMVTFVCLAFGWILYRLTFPIVVERFSS